MSNMCLKFRLGLSLIILIGFSSVWCRSDGLNPQPHSLAKLSNQFLLEGDEADRQAEAERDRLHDLKYKGRGKLTCQSCQSPHCEDDTPFGTCSNALRCFTSNVRDSNGQIHRSRGCTRDLADTAFHCSVAAYDGRKVHEKTSNSAQYAVTCCKVDLCNNGTDWPRLPPVPILETDLVQVSEDDGHLNRIVVILLVIFVPFLIFGALAWLAFCEIRRRHRKRMAELNQMDMYGGTHEGDELVALRARPVGDSTLREFRDGDGSLTSGSGSGLPFLVQRTLAKQIQLGGCIGKGRYGEVWQGTWNGDSVAVKIFFSRHESSWKRETDIYSTILLRHENILGYIGSDFTSHNSCTQIWLVTHFHPHGSLYDYLNKPVVLGPREAHKMILSALNGIVHLHTEIHGTQGKPGIAHRDIKSKNILVKYDGSCMIADFGLAVTHKEATDELNIPENSRVGTKRYMSPEILDLSINEKKTFEAFRQSDVYSFALVIWEVLRRTDLNLSEADSYALPYHQDVGPDPSFDEMRKVVCLDQRRPLVNERWSSDPITHGIARMMQECWYEDPNARPSSLRLKKSIAALLKPLNAPSNEQPSPFKAFTPSIS
ncbi:hypothetical protein TCAL_16255 [Tigriopus californicus]|uniref:receptor protein serine/threonine kinase n=1 Tax=Tigriopus californicus TaxID=6832 RepID=A0A553N7B6_TIGCA|nr:activin receptor type-1-like [Tigriopus californicus]TRY61300.1 hypothetical protein TCAL_16255 [Tigriopus californicus]